MMCDSRRPLDGADSVERSSYEINGTHYLTIAGFRSMAAVPVNDYGESMLVAGSVPAGSVSQEGSVPSLPDFHVPADCDRCEPDSYGLIEGRLCSCDCHSGLTADRRAVTWTGRDGVQR